MKFKKSGIKIMSRSKKLIKLAAALLAVAILFSLTALPVSAEHQNDKVTEVILGGGLFGLKIQTKGVAIVELDKVTTKNGVSSPAFDAGLKPNDSIVSMGGIAVTTVDQVSKILETFNGSKIDLTVLRNNELKTVSVTPQKGTDGKFHLGIWIRDSAAGIGTVTYIDPKTYEFAGLGHGICADTAGKLLQTSRGIMSGVELIDIVKGTKGAPGEIKGAFKVGKIGSVTKNTSSGVYGAYSSLPNDMTQLITVAKPDEICEGKATIRSAVSGKIEEYCVNISKIDLNNTNGKCFSVTVTDPRLIEITGGIVQGMSGSPIIQNGKLVGAVTHVMINDPTVGYGIFIENMLAAAQMPQARAS